MELKKFICIFTLSINQKQNTMETITLTELEGVKKQTLISVALKQYLEGFTSSSILKHLTKSYGCTRPTALKVMSLANIPY